MATIDLQAVIAKKFLDQKVRETISKCGVAGLAEPADGGGRRNRVLEAEHLDAAASGLSISQKTGAGRAGRRRHPLRSEP